MRLCWQHTQFCTLHLPAEKQEEAVIMVYKLHPGDIIGAGLRWHGAVITTANNFITVFFSFPLHCTFLRKSHCTDTCLLDVAHCKSLLKLQSLYFHYYIRRNTGRHRISREQILTNCQQKQVRAVKIRKCPWYPCFHCEEHLDCGPRLGKPSSRLPGAVL